MATSIIKVGKFEVELNAYDHGYETVDVPDEMEDTMEDRVFYMARALDIHRAAVIALLHSGEYKGKLRSHDGGKCGLHVHLDKPTNLRHSARLTEFYNAPDNAALIKAVARRYSSQEVVGRTRNYAKAVTKGKGDKLAARVFKTHKRGHHAPKDAAKGAIRSLTADRYELVNFLPEKTVEIRAFRGSMVPTTVIACLEFAYLSWVFAKDFRAMTTEAFIEFISRQEWRHESRYLRQYLTNKGFTPWMPSNPLTSEPVQCGDETEEVSAPAVSETTDRTPRIFWPGGPRPVDGDVLVSYWLRGGPDNECSPIPARTLRWRNTDSWNDIIAFRAPVGTRINHVSNDRPVPANTFIRVTTRSGNAYADRAQQFDWSQDIGDETIETYQIAEGVHT